MEWIPAVASSGIIVGANSAKLHPQTNGSKMQQLMANDLPQPHGATLVSVAPHIGLQGTDHPMAFLQGVLFALPHQQFPRWSQSPGIPTTECALSACASKTHSPSEDVQECGTTAWLLPPEMETIQPSWPPMTSALGQALSHSSSADGSTLPTL